MATYTFIIPCKVKVEFSLYEIEQRKPKDSNPTEYTVEDEILSFEITSSLGYEDAKRMLERRLSGED